MCSNTVMSTRLLHHNIRLNLPSMELVQNCEIPPRTLITFYSIPDTNALTHIQFTFNFSKCKINNIHRGAHVQNDSHTQ